jgi:hypothetical protein
MVCVSVFLHPLWCWRCVWSGDIRYSRLASDVLQSTRGQQSLCAQQQPQPITLPVRHGGIRGCVLGGQVPGWRRRPQGIAPGIMMRTLSLDLQPVSRLRCVAVRCGASNVCSCCGCALCSLHTRCVCMHLCNHSSDGYPLCWTRAHGRGDLRHSSEGRQRDAKLA